jgi:NitT/TauT family transport system permease protein/sulfonate transport system permease protein
MPSTSIRGGSAGWRARLAERCVTESIVVLALVGWWAMSRTLPPYLFPDIPTVLHSIAMLVTDPAFAGHTFASVARIVVSITLALALGTLLAVIPRYVPAADEFIHGRVKPVLNSFPSLGWALLGSIWFGVSSGAVIFIQTAILVPFALINISEGLKEISDESQEMALSFTRSRRRVFLLVIVPMLYPYFIAALRIAYGVAWKVSLVSELFGATSGLGFLLMDAQSKGRIDLVFAICLLIVLLYVIGEKLIVDPLSRLYRGGQ